MKKQQSDSSLPFGIDWSALLEAVKSICLVALAILSFVALIWVVMAIICAVQNLVS